MDGEENFWNNPETIKWFNEQPAPDYWKKFFEEKRGKIKKVLDLGCGAGRNTQLLIWLGYDVYACDWYSGMIKTTRERLHKIGLDKPFIEKRVIKASMVNLPYRDNFFDAVLSNGVYHNISSLKEMRLAFKETSRILKNSGYLCFNLFSSNYIDSSFKVIGEQTYLTREGLPMVLISKKQFLDYFSKFGMKLTGEIVEYEREVSTGKRSVMRGILEKSNPI